MDKIKYLTILVIILAVLNAATLAFIWLQRPAGAGPQKGSGEDPAVLLARQLGFSQQQQQQFEELRALHQIQMKIWGDSLKTLKERQYSLLISHDPVGAGAVIQAIGEVHRQIEQVTFDHFSRALQLCTPQQRQQYEKMLYRAITDIPRQTRDQPRNDRGQNPPAGQNEDSRNNSSERGFSPGREEGNGGRQSPVQGMQPEQKNDRDKRTPPPQGEPSPSGN